MRIEILTIVFLIGILSVMNAQDNVNKNQMLEFACYFEGSQSITVQKITNKLGSKNYKAISKLLVSDNNAERYMAVITLEKLDELKKYDLNEIEKELILEIKKSEELVSVCSGCTYFEKVSLKEILSEKSILFAENWLNQNFKTD